MDLPALPPRYVEPVLIGEGATGVVYRVVDRDTDEVAAIKVVRRHLAILDRFRARFARETALSASLVHPAIVPVRDFGHLDTGQPFVVMDLADLGSLADRPAGSVSLGQLLTWVCDVLDALAHLHAQGLVHRDIKPENILLKAVDGGSPKAWVADFGLAGATIEVAFTGDSIAGTREWMAPEQADGRAHELGPSTDLYAVGLVLLRALGGRPVRLERSPDTQRYVPGDVHLPNDVPDELARIVRTLLHEDPRQRYDLAADVRRLIGRVRADLEDDQAAETVTGELPPTTSTVFPVPVEPGAIASVANLRLSAVGIDGPAPSWNRVAPGALPPRPPPMPGLGSRSHALAVVALREPAQPMRAEVRDAVWQAARDVVDSGRPRVVLLIGQDGSGKGRLAEGLGQALEVGGFMESVTLRYHDPPAEDDGYRGCVLELLVPWNDVRAEAEERLAGWIARDRSVPPRAVEAEARALARWCGYRSDKEAPANSALGLAYLLRHLDARAWRGGAALILQNLHHARSGGDGFDLCRALLEETVGVRPLLAIGTVSREALDDPDVASRVAALTERGAQRIDVDRLSPAETVAFLSGSLGLSAELAAAVASSCGGSPTFCTLLVRDLAVRGLLRRGDDGLLEVAEGFDVGAALPGTLEALAARRIDAALASTESAVDCALALSVVALAGQAPPALVVRAASPDGLDLLLGTGLVRQQGFRIVFEAQVIRDVVVRRAEAQANLADVHAKLADAWAKLGETAGADVDLAVGRHRLAAEDPQQAVTPLLRASRTSLAAGRPSLAALAAELALDAATRVDRRMARVEARQHLAAALLKLGRPAEVARLLGVVGGAWQMDRRSQAQDCLLRARAAMALGELAEAGRLLERGAAGFEATQDRPGMMESAAGQAQLHRLAGRPEAAAERYTRMLRLNTGQDAASEVVALAGRIECRLAAGVRDVEADLQRLRRVARLTGDTRSIARAAFVAGLAHHRRGRPGAAERQLRTALALAATLGDDRLLVDCHNVLGEVARQSAQLTRADRAYAEAARTALRHGWRREAAIAELNRSLVQVTRRDVAQARAHHLRAAELLRLEPTHWAQIFVALLDALWAVDDERHVDALTAMDRAEARGLPRMRVPDAVFLLQRIDGWSRSPAVRARARELLGVSAPLPPPVVAATHDAADPPTDPTVSARKG